MSIYILQSTEIWYADRNGISCTSRNITASLQFSVLINNSHPNSWISSRQIGGLPHQIRNSRTTENKIVSIVYWKRKKKPPGQNDQRHYRNIQTSKYNEFFQAGSAAQLFIKRSRSSRLYRLSVERENAREEEKER